MNNGNEAIQDQATQVHHGRKGEKVSNNVHHVIFWVATCHLVADKQCRNHCYPDTEICQSEWNDKRVSFSSKISFASNKEDNKSIPCYRQNGKKPANNPKPGFHFFVTLDVSPDCNPGCWENQYSYLSCYINGLKAPYCSKKDLGYLSLLFVDAFT